jgi:hypothetical protein
MLMKGINPHDEIKGSSPSPGAYFKEPRTSLKAHPSESRVVVATTMEDSTPKKQQQQITTSYISPGLQTAYSSFLLEAYKMYVSSGVF